MVELTMRLLVNPVLLFAALLLPPSTPQALEGFSSLTSLRGLGNGRQPLSREEELMKALQFLEEYERNLEDAWVDEEDTYDGLQPGAFPFVKRGDIDEDIVPEDVWEDDQDDIFRRENNGQIRKFLQNLLDGANRNRDDDVVPQGYIYPQRSTGNNQYVLFSPVGADLEDEIALEEAIEKLKVKEKEEKLWEDILGDMLAEEILETDAKEDIKELIDLEEEEEQIFDEDSIFEEEDPWSEIESSEVIVDDSDVVPWSWAAPEWEEEEGDESSSLVAEFEESLTSEEEDEIEREAAVILLEDILAEEEKEQRKEQEQEEILEMIMGEESAVDEEDLGDTIYDSSVTEEDVENYFKALLNTNEEDGELLEEVSDESENSEESSEGWEEEEVAFSSAPEELNEKEGEIIQDYGINDNSDEEELDYNMLLREITNEIEAAAEEVEEEVVAALRNKLQDNNIGYLTAEDEADLDEDNSSNELDELEAEQILSMAGMPEKYELPVQEEKRTGSGTCPIIRSLVDDCAFIDNFPDVDDNGRYKNKFQRACNRHQLCYTCGQNYDIESTLCDEVFDAEMLAECGLDQECIETADQFLFIATNTHTRDSQPPSICHDKCLLPFLIRD